MPPLILGTHTSMGAPESVWEWSVDNDEPVSERERNLAALTEHQYATGRGSLGLLVGAPLTGRRCSDLELLATARSAETALADQTLAGATR